MNQDTLYVFFILSTIAFFTMDCISEGLNSALLFDVAFDTQNFASLVRYFSQAIAFVPSKSSSNVVALKLPHLSIILSAVLINTFALAIASSSPANVILPSSTWTISYPRSCISLFSTDSSPKWHGAISSTLLIYRPFLISAILSSLSCERSLILCKTTYRVDYFVAVLTHGKGCPHTAYTALTIYDQVLTLWK